MTEVQLPAVDATVIVPTHRGAHRLPALLEALACQDYEGDWEALIVVDGDLDGSTAVLASYTGRLPLRVIVNPQPQGVTKVMNTGIEASRGRIVIRCDDDLSPGPSFVRTHLSHHEAAGRVGIIGPTRDVFPDSAYADLYGRPATARSLEAAYSRADELAWIGWAANNSVSREELMAVGGFDTDFVYGQDSELGYRLHRAGVKISVDADLQVDHRGPSTAASTRVPRAFISGASKRLFYRRHPEAMPQPVRVVGPKDRVWRLLVKTLSSAVRSRDGYARVGVFLDRFIEIAPAAVASRALSLAVESAGASGLRNGADDLSSYRVQKSTEVARELRRATAAEKG